MNKRNKTYTRMQNIPEFIYTESEKRAKNQKTFDRSHRKEQANEVGCLGEVIAEYWMHKNGIHFESELEQKTHDYRINDSLTIDVKTKDRTVKPKSDYDNSAPLYNHTFQRPDYFLFISLERDKSNRSGDIRRFRNAYILGAISYDELDKIGIPFLKGETDWRNGTKFWTDCLNVEMWQLIPLEETIQIFKGQRNSPTENAHVNQKIVEEMRKRIDTNELKPRKLPILEYANKLKL